MTNENTTQATLDAWQAQLAQIQKRTLERGGGQAGLAHPHQVHGKTGLQVMTALLDGELPHPYMADTFDCELVEVGDGHAVFQATPQLKHYNPLGSVHGGWYATLLDFALGCAVQTRLPAGRGYTTSQINLHIVRAANTKTGPLRCVGTALHVGRQIATSEARIVGPDGKLFAHATTTSPSSNRHLLRLEPKCSYLRIPLSGRQRKRSASNATASRPESALWTISARHRRPMNCWSRSTGTAPNLTN